MTVPANTLDGVIEVLESHYGPFTKPSNTKDLLMSDFNFDSLDLVEIAMALEDRFGIDIPSDAMDSDPSVAEIVRLVEAARGVAE